MQNTLILPMEPSPSATNLSSTTNTNTNTNTNSSEAVIDVVCMGELLIDFVPTISGLSLADTPAFQKAPGGAPANVAVAVSRLGGTASFIGKVGDDEFGRMLASVLSTNGVATRGLRFDPHARTALAFVTLTLAGEREFMFFRNPSADMMLMESELDSGSIEHARIFHFGSIGLIAEPCRGAQIAAVKLARAAGAILSYDPNLRLPLWPSANEARAGILSLWEEADIIKVSEEEIWFLARDPTIEDADMSTMDTSEIYNAARKLMHPRLRLLVVTLGADGCHYFTPFAEGHMAGIALPEGAVVDTTGAGDAFVGGLLKKLSEDVGLLEDEARLRDALHFANACGAITTTVRGAIPALPDTTAVLQLLASSST